ncbi:phage holin, lambda family [Escherichia coli]|nr:phage holin, lambda family [Escherichia coli]
MCEVRDDEMPHNPNTWPDWLELFQSWWRGDTPLGAVVMSIIMAGLRIAYFGGGGGWKRKTLEILLCGALTLTFASALEYVGWPKSLSVAIGGGVGLIGVDAIRGAAMRVIGNKFGAHKE